MVKKDITTLQKVDVVYIPIEDLKPNEYNPNRQSDKDFELLCRSIEEDGFTSPVLAQKETLEIIDGEHRWRALKALGYTECPCVLVTMSQAQQMISTLRHNRARGTERLDLAADVLKDLDHMGSLDAAADSLMMDDIEITIMLDSIPNAEISLRTPGDKMTVEEVKDQLAQEKKIQEDAQAKDVATARKEVARTTTISFKITYQDKKRIEQGLEDILPGGDTKDQILELLHLYEHNAEAMTAARQGEPGVMALIEKEAQQ